MFSCLDYLLFNLSHFEKSIYNAKLTKKNEICMFSFNRGEWSELYATLFLLLEPKLLIVDDDLNELTNEIFELQQILISANNDLKYIIKDRKVIVFIENKEYSELSNEAIKSAKESIINAIKNNEQTNGAFQIVELNNFLKKFSNDAIVKAKSFKKEDIVVIARDNKINNDVELKYSIKSSLGSPATLLNSSQHTNFRFKVSNLKDKDIDEINSINGRTKLLDRVREINERDGIIEFDKVLSESFEYNLKMIDENMPIYLANTLLASYISNTKDLKELFMNSNLFDDKNFAIKKLSDLLNAICFSFVPSIKWDGKQVVNGGFIIIKENGKVVILDLIYYKEYVIKYLINNSKLDSPSSTRYHMLELCKDGKNVYFTLNLQWKLFLINI